MMGCVFRILTAPMTSFSSALITWYLRENQHALRTPELRNVESGWSTWFRGWGNLGTERLSSPWWVTQSHSYNPFLPTPNPVLFALCPKAALSLEWLPVFTVSRCSQVCWLYFVEARCEAGWWRRQLCCLTANLQAKLAIFREQCLNPERENS